MITLEPTAAAWASCPLSAPRCQENKGSVQPEGRGVISPLMVNKRGTLTLEKYFLWIKIQRCCQMGQEERMEPGDKKAESEVSELCHTLTVLNLTETTVY